VIPVEVTLPAQADLVEAWRYLADNAGVDVADTVLDRLDLAINSLAEWPELGHYRKDITRKPIRFLHVVSYLIVYRASSKRVTVLRVLHASRDASSELDDS
jgi:toxin ParE1/3/4